MAHKLIETLREVSPRNAMRVGVSHLILLAACIWAGLPYLFLQAILAVELILINLAMIPLYPQRGVITHLWDLTKVMAGLTFAAVFIVIGYGITGSGDNEALKASLFGLRDLGMADVLWALAYLVLRIGMSLHSAMKSPDPRQAWARNTLVESGTGFVSFFLMAFVGFLVGLPVISGLALLGINMDVDLLLCTLMIAVRCIVALVFTTMKSAELESIAGNPYVDH